MLQQNNNDMKYYKKNKYNAVNNVFSDKSDQFRFNERQARVKVV